MALVLSSVPLVRVRVIRTANNTLPAGQRIKASPTVRSLSVAGQHGFIDPLDDVLSTLDGQTGVDYLDLVATDDPDVAESFGWTISLVGSARAARVVSVPQSGSIVEQITVPDAQGNGTHQMPAVWLHQLADFTGPSGATGSDLASRTYVDDSIYALQQAPDPFPQYAMDGEGGGGSSTPDATTSVKGKARLLGGTADAPTVPYSSVTGGPASLPPSGGAGGVLGGSYPNPSFAVDMATQAELDAGLASNATADRARTNHTGQQTSATISDFTEAVQDAVAALLGAGSNIVLNYDDAANSLTITGVGDGTGLDAEAVRDAIGVALVGVGNISVVVNDAADTITITTTATANSSDAALRDRSTHTGTQSVATVDGLQTALDAKTAKLTQRSTAATAATTAAANEIVPLDTTGGAFPLTGPSAGAPFGARWKAGTAAPTITAPVGYTIAGAASVSMGLAPGGSTGELVVWQAFGTDYQPVGGSKPQSALAAVFQPVITLATAKGDGSTIDTATINAILAAAPADAVVRGVPGKNYFIDAPLITRAGGRQTLDMTGCTVTLKPSQNCNLVRNAGATAVTTASDGAMTSASSTLTTAASASVGQTVTVAGAGANGNAPLTAQVTAVGSGTLTLSSPAQATVSAAAVKVFTRDRDVRIIGGNWARGANFGAGTDNHSLLFRHVDGLTVDIEGFSSTAGKYALSVASATRGWLRARNLSGYSDGVHLMGPLNGIRVDEITGTTGDDTFAITAADWTAYGDTCGDVVDVSVGRINATSTAASLCKVIAGAGCKVDAFRVTDGVYGTAALNVAWLGDDSAQASTTGGSYGSVDFGTLYGSAPTALLNAFSPSARVVRARIVNNQTGALDSIVRVQGTSTATISLLVVHGSDVAKIAALTGGGVYVSSSTVTIGTVLIDSSRFALPGSIVNIGNGTLGDVVIRNCRVEQSDGTSYVVRAVGGTIARLTYIGGLVTGGNVAFRKENTSTTATVVTFADGFVALAMSRVADVRAGTTTFRMFGAHFDTLTNAAFYTSGGTMVFDGSITTAGTFTMLQRAGSESVRSLGPSLPFDVLALAQQAGDVAQNTNSATAGGVGRVISDGTRWLPVARPLASGTAVLSAGAATVTDTKITASSLIRLTVLAPGGTVGAVYVASRTAGTGFTINSTSSSDTSTVFWEVAQY